MRITSIDIFKIDIGLTHATRVPIGLLDAAHNVFLRINTDAGICGWGEASPFQPITADTQDSSLATARMLATGLIGKDPLAIGPHMRNMRLSVHGQTSILAAFDMSLYDIAGQAAGLPVYALLGGDVRELRSDFTIGMQDSVNETLALLEEGLGNGFDAVKLKVGRAGLVDRDYVTAVRERVGANVSLKIDSNQGWDYDTALANLNALRPFDIQYSEQPTPASDYESLKRLRDNTAIPICADESMFNSSDAQTLIDMNAVDYLNIKLGKSGGIQAGLKIDAIAESAGCKCMIGCFAESRLGLTAAAHLAIARPNIVFIDLDSAYGFKTDPIDGGGSFDKADGGIIRIDDAPGFGAALSDKFVESSHWARVR